MDDLRATELLEQLTPELREKHEERERELINLKKTYSWEVLKEIIDSYILELRDVNVKAEDSVGTVGYKYLASRTATHYLESIISTVENAGTEPGKPTGEDL